MSGDVLHKNQESIIEKQVRRNIEGDDNQLELRNISSNEEISQLSRLAATIWREHYSSILDEAQIEYMLSNFQSEEAIKNQIVKEGYEYCFLVVDHQVVGYTAFKLHEKDLFLSKLYIKKEERMKGYGSQTFALIENVARVNKKSSLWLTVNRFNEASILAYKKNGFQILRSQVTDIQGGYVMDDYVMEKNV